MTENYKDQASAFWLKSAIFSSERMNGLTIDITNSISDFLIYEDINLPFLTGKIVFVDFNNIIDSMRYSGDEKIELTINKPGSDFDIVRTFFIDRITSSIKSNEAVESYFFHVIEDIAFKASTININKYYTGNTLEIVKNILKEYTGRNLQSIYTGIPSGDVLKVIIPNLDPIEAVMWVKKKALTPQGMPYFLYSSFGESNDINFNDLSSLISQRPINQSHPFLHSFGSTQAIDLSSNEIEVLKYKTEEMESLYDLIKLGLIGGTHEFYDTVNGKEKVVNLNINNALDNLEKTNWITKEQREYFFPKNVTLDETNLGELKSNKTFTYPSNRPYETGFSKSSSFSESVDKDSYANKVIGKALHHFINKVRLTVTVPGSNFIKGDAHYTVGNVAAFKFLNSTGKEDGTGVTLDTKKSGNYLITNCVHIFKPENYNITMGISKLQNFVEEKT